MVYMGDARMMGATIGRCAQRKGPHMPMALLKFNIISGEVLGGPAYKQLKSHFVEEREKAVFADLQKKELFFLFKFYAAFVADVFSVAFL